MARILSSDPVTAGPEMEIKVHNSSSRKHILAASFLIVGASLLPRAPAMAAEPQISCAATSSPRPAKKKDLELGGLLGAAKRAGAGNLLGSGIIGEGEAARAAEAAQAAAKTAAELARSSANNCNSKEPTAQRRETQQTGSTFE